MLWCSKVLQRGPGGTGEVKAEKKLEWEWELEWIGREGDLGQKQANVKAEELRSINES